MTLEEVARKYDMEPEILKNQFKRKQAQILKKYGVLITKMGRGDKTVYTEEIMNDGRALTIYEEKQDSIVIGQDTIRLDNWQFFIFVTIVTTPLKVFRGSYKDFLSYMGTNISEENILTVQLALRALEQRGFIMYVIDKTDNNYFTATLVRKAEVEMQVGIEMIRDCKRIAEANNKRSWIPLFKTWLAIIIAEEHQPFTNKELEQLTGMSEYTIRENKKLLEKSNVFKTRKKYIDYQTCIGQMVDLNAFYSDKNTYLIEEEKENG